MQDVLKARLQADPSSPYAQSLGTIANRPLRSPASPAPGRPTPKLPANAAQQNAKESIQRMQATPAAAPAEAPPIPATPLPNDAGLEQRLAMLRAIRGGGGYA